MKFRVSSPFKTRTVMATDLPKAIEDAMDDLLFARTIDPEAFEEAKIKLELVEEE